MFVLVHYYVIHIIKNQATHWEYYDVFKKQNYICET